ncbi:uncharacterized protein LOC135165897 [Diachasmimorpha longicaudata]|uniref:uncharacterized protein LOC135165897 n=1 Tax=Diachasmimorpha longicaudata TaxID=58733 RepID=UPI0030B86BA1
MDTKNESVMSLTMHDELATIQGINRGLDNLQWVSSTGEKNSLQQLLEIPEMNDFEDLNEETISYIESFVTDPGEQAIVSANDDLVKEMENTTEVPSSENVITQDELSEVQINGEISGSSSSRYFSFANIFGAKRDSNQSTSSSAASKKSYFSRLFSPRRSETTSPVSNFSIPSCNSENDKPEVDSDQLAVAEEFIRETEAQCPAGTPHLSSLARTVNRPILAFSSSMSLRHRAGSGLEGSPIMIQFHSPRPGMSTGHWTLLGNTDPEGLPEEMSLNNCLFNVVCALTGHKPSVLRKETIREMRKHINSLAKRIQVMRRLEECDVIVILLGGASYQGTSSRSAQRVIDDSQQGRCHPNNLQGHPRGHASYPEARGPTESAENYSRGGWKTGFLSRNDQDVVGHMALQTSAAQNAMAALNRGTQSEAVTLNASELPGSLPAAAEFTNGNIQRPRPIKQLVLVLRHHAGQANNPSYPVFVHTFYPKVT